MPSDIVKLKYGFISIIGHFDECKRCVYTRDLRCCEYVPGHKSATCHDHELNRISSFTTVFLKQWNLARIGIIKR